MSSDHQFHLPRPSEVLVPSLRKGSSESGKNTQWNTANLGMRLGADATSAAAASAMVAPVICIIDRSIVSKAASGRPLSTCLLESLKPALTRPHTFLISKPFLLIFSLYFSTYVTANSIDTMTNTIESKPANKVTSSTSKFVATSVVNMSMCVYKDSQYARMFSAGSTSPAAAIPKLSYALFAARDSMTIFASFNLPSIIGPKLADLPPVVKDKFSRILSTESGRANTAQFITPAAMQIFSTPIHLLGLDLYNRPGQLGFSARSARIVRDWGVSAFARMGRIIPAFGVGGVVNAKMRRGMMDDIEQKS